ncbi:MAG: amidase [Rhizobiaceae bacterium]
MAYEFGGEPISVTARRLREGSLTSVKITREAIMKIEREDRSIKSFALVTKERALADAHAADAAFRAGHDKGIMHGIPYAIKDVFDTRGIRTEANSRAFANRVPSTDAAVVERLNEAGAVLLGKLSCYECSTIGPDPTLPCEPVRNPWNTDYVTGGSSSGSGAAVAAGFVAVAIGSDTAGSVRGPAGYCGVFGLKPTSGLISRRGLMPLSHTMDHVGVIGATPHDIAAMMGVLVEHDSVDRASRLPSKSIFDKPLAPWAGPIRVGVPRHHFTVDRQAGAEIQGLIDRSLNTLADAGAHIEEITLPSYEAFEACGRVIMLSEAFSLYEDRLRAEPHLFGPHMHQWITPGAFITESDYLSALRLRKTLTEEMDRVLLRHDVIMTASILTPAPKFSDLPPDRIPTIDMQGFPATLTGHPALAVPIGFSSEKLPLSMQLLGRRMDDERLIQVALWLQVLI